MAQRKQSFAPSSLMVVLRDVGDFARVLIKALRKKTLMNKYEALPCS